MKGIIINQFFQHYFISFLYELMLYLVMCRCFQLKISKRKALILAFLCANFLPITDTLSIIYIGGGIIPASHSIFVMLKIFCFLEELILIGFITIAFEIAWYRSYWITIILHTFLLIPYSLIYYRQFITSRSGNFMVIRPLTLDLLPNYLVTIVVNIAWGFLFLYLSKYLRNFKKLNQISKWSWFAIYSAWTYVLIVSNKTYLPSENSDILKSTQNLDQIFLAIIAIIIIMFLSINFSDKRLLKVENKLLKEQHELQYANYLMLQQQEMQIHKLYHDIGNHIKTIQILVNNDENQEAKEYTENLVQIYRDIHKEYYCRNKIINAVLSQKMKLCDQYGISFDVDIQIPDKLEIRDIDLMSVYANLLDNAIESCQRNESERNYIKMKTSVIGDYFTVKIINSKSEDGIAKAKNGYMTSKRNKSMHGYGLRILEEIVAKYNGQKEFLDNGKEFSAMVMLKMNKMNQQVDSLAMN